jgi:hypothetical protein
MPSGSCWCTTTPTTHTPASLDAAFPPAEAKRLADRLELHSTPSTAAGCSMAEIELAVLAGQCLDRRLADRAMLQREVAAWQAARNRAGRGVNWRFTTEDARVKLKRLPPATQGRQATRVTAGEQDRGLLAVDPAVPDGGGYPMTRYQRSSGRPHPRVENCVAQIDEDVGDHDEERGKQDGADDHRQVLVGD